MRPVLAKITVQNAFLDLHKNIVFYKGHAYPVILCIAKPAKIMKFALLVRTHTF